MNRGYIKFWRKAQDSSSWNRGLMYQGLIINLLSRAAWKKSSYKGRDILPGQFGASINQMADSLGVPRTTMKRMVVHFVEDGLLTVENVGHRFTIFTIVNWGIYQASEREQWTADGPPVVHQRTADGPPSYSVEEVKKEEEIRDLNPPPVVNTSRARVEAPATGEGGEGGDLFAHDRGPKKTDSPSKGSPEWKAFLACWEVYPVKQGREEAWREWMRLRQNGTLAQAWEIRDAVLRLSGEDSRWLRGKVPKMAKWLYGKGWDDEPFVEPADLPPGAQRDPPPKSPEQIVREKAEAEQILAAMTQAARKRDLPGRQKEAGWP